MKQTATLLLACAAGMFAINLSIADEKQDLLMEQTIQELTEENVLLTQSLREQDTYGLSARANEIHKTEEKIESDLRNVTTRFFKEDMNIHVNIEENSPGEFTAVIGIGTDLPRQFYPELTDLIEKTVSMEHVQVLIVEK